MPKTVKHSVRPRKPVSMLLTNAYTKGRKYSWMPMHSASSKTAKASWSGPESTKTATKARSTTRRQSQASHK